MNNLIQTFKTNGKYIAAGIALIVAIIAYNIFYLQPRQADQDAGFIRSENQMITSTEIGREIVVTLNRLKTISIDPEFFNEERYQMLVDYSVEIQPQAVSRENPFEEIDFNTLGQRTTAAQDSSGVIGNVSEENLEQQSNDVGEFNTQTGTSTSLEGGQVI